MHARITKVRARPGKAGELVETTRDAILPAARDLEGFGGMLGLIDEGSGHAQSHYRVRIHELDRERA